MSGGARQLPKPSPLPSSRSLRRATAGEPSQLSAKEVFSTGSCPDFYGAARPTVSVGGQVRARHLGLLKQPARPIALKCIPHGNKAQGCHYGSPLLRQCFTAKSA